MVVSNFEGGGGISLFSLAGVVLNLFSRVLSFGQLCWFCFLMDRCLSLVVLWLLFCFCDNG